MSNPECPFHRCPTFRAVWYKGVAGEYETFVCSDERHGANNTGDQYSYISGNNYNIHKSLRDRLLRRYRYLKGYRICEGDTNSS